jgi:hypothetical protein
MFNYCAKGQLMINLFALITQEIFEPVSLCFILRTTYAERHSIPFRMVIAVSHLNAE